MKITNKLKATLRKMLSLQLGEVEVDGGKKLFWSTEDDLKEGIEVFVEDENGELKPAEDGAYTTPDGKTITVTDGIVETIKDPEAEVAPELEEAEPAEEPAEEPQNVVEEDKIEDRVAALETKTGEILSAFEQVLNAIASLEGRIEELEGKVAKVDATPAADPVSEIPAESPNLSRIDILKNLRK